MSKAKLASVLVLVGIAAAIPITAMSRPATVKPNIFAGSVDVSGLTTEQARLKVRIWWENERKRTIEFTSKSLSLSAIRYTPGQVGIALDDVATIAQLPTDNAFDGAQQVVTGVKPARQDFPLVFRWISNSGEQLIPPDLIWAVEKAAPEPVPASVDYRNGAILLKKEVAGVQLDRTALTEATLASLQEEWKVEIPLKEAPKRVPDEELEKIREVVSSYSTRFSAGNRPRSANIRLAASFLNRLVVMPGERVSYNDSVGRRTLKRGFKVAGVFINGQHDTGVGGGICQVSTTLYNAALYANLKVVRRQNHSLPVPYVPQGRDATVDYGNIDLVIENSMKTPIALMSEYVPGRLTFRILGEKDPAQSIKIIQTPAKKGINTFRLVYRDGELLKRESLGRSVYYGLYLPKPKPKQKPKPPEVTAAVPANAPAGVPVPHPDE
jgi:hypothetical protein